MRLSDIYKKVAGDPKYSTLFQNTGQQAAVRPDTEDWGEAAPQLNQYNTPQGPGSKEGPDLKIPARPSLAWFEQSGLFDKMPKTEADAIREYYLGGKTTAGGGMGDKAPSVDAGLPGWSAPAPGGFLDKVTGPVMKTLAGAFPMLRATDDPAQLAAMKHWGIRNPDLRDVPGIISPFMSMPFASLFGLPMHLAAKKLSPSYLAAVSPAEVMSPSLSDAQASFADQAMKDFGFDPSTGMVGLSGMMDSPLGGFDLGNAMEGGLTGWDMGPAIGGMTGWDGGMTGWDGGSSPLDGVGSLDPDGEGDAGNVL